MSRLYVLWFVVFFFKQKTAYEMRISDWSSDVCSSDLLHHDLEAIGSYGLIIAGVVPRREGILTPAVGGDDVGELARLQSLGALEHQMLEKVREPRFAEIGRASCRERVCQYV